MHDEIGAVVTAPTSLEARLAGAPISWGVSEVPGWGYQLDPERVLAEMHGLGLRATEFGPVGFLADDPATRAAQLGRYGMTAVGGFLPILLHDPCHDPSAEADAFIDGCLASGADCMVLAASTGDTGYDDRPALDELGWKTMVAHLDQLADHAERRGVTASLHPHVGTMVERSSEVVRVLEASRVGLCLDTGHLTVGQCDPVSLATTYADRVSHVHLKDVDATLAQQVITGELAFQDAVRAGMFCPLGQGDVDIAALVRELEVAGYDGWYVLEQDVMLDDDGQAADTTEHVRSSLDFLLGTTP